MPQSISVRHRNRRHNLFKKNPHCNWCGRKLTWYDMPHPARLPNDFPTLDHLNSRSMYPKGRPVTHQESTVLACKPCNQRRGVVENKVMTKSMPMLIRRWKCATFPKQLWFVNVLLLIIRRKDPRRATWLPKILLTKKGIQRRYRNK